MDKCACGPLTEVTLWVRLKLRNYGGSGRRGRRLFRKASLPTKVDTDIRVTLRCAERDKRWAAQQKASRIFVKCVLKGEKSKAYRYRWLHVPKEEDYCRTRYISVLVNFGDPTHKCLSPHALHETSTLQQPAAAPSISPPRS